MPGYAAGATFFYRNLRGLAEHANVHLVDWLGTGLSGRPPFRCQSREEAEDWFVESLERWRKEEGLEDMVLVGHSLGGYLSANYALRFPQHVKHLVLVNPAGMVRENPSIARRATAPPHLHYVQSVLGLPLKNVCTFGATADVGY
jgi:abhydrolase domain-containing protein 5